MHAGKAPWQVRINAGIALEQVSDADDLCSINLYYSKESTALEDLLYSKGMPVGLLPAANPRISKRHLGIGARSIYLLVYMSGRYAVISNKVTCGGEPGRGAAAGCLLLGRYL
jgi:hypothetical protein